MAVYYVMLSERNFHVVETEMTLPELSETLARDGCALVSRLYTRAIPQDEPGVRVYEVTGRAELIISSRGFWSIHTPLGCRYVEFD